MQRVFLVAILRLIEEKEFLILARFNAAGVVMLRGRTTQRNNRYRVVFAESKRNIGDDYNAQQEAENKTAIEIVIK
jgi:hypothetical protein